MDLWQRCSEHLEQELPAQQFNTWIRPLQVVEEAEQLKLLAPNRFVLDWVKNNYLDTIQNLVVTLSQGDSPTVMVEIGSKKRALQQPKIQTPVLVSPKTNRQAPVESNLCRR